MVSGRLLVEGTGDKYFLEKLLEHNPLRHRVKVYSRQGLRNLVRVLPEDLKAVRSEDRLGIVLDADYDIARRWEDVRGILQGQGYKDVPEKPGSGGTIVKTEGKAMVGVWVMPDNRANGMLEDFVRFLVPPGDRSWPLAEAAVEGVMGKIPCGPHKRSKAILYTWLAWQEEPGLSLSSAVEEQYLDRDADEVKRFVAWLQRLFT